LWYSAFLGSYVNAHLRGWSLVLPCSY